MEVCGDQKTVCSDPCCGVGKAGCAESQQVYKNKSYDRACRHFKDTGQNSDLTVPHTLNTEAQHVDARQRDEEKAVANEKNMDLVDQIPIGRIGKQRSQTASKQKEQE